QVCGLREEVGPVSDARADADRDEALGQRIGAARMELDASREGGVDGEGRSPLRSDALGRGWLRFDRAYRRALVRGMEARADQDGGAGTWFAGELEAKVL